MTIKLTNVLASMLLGFYERIIPLHLLSCSCRASPAGGGNRVKRDGGRIRLRQAGLQHSLPVLPRLPLLCVLVRGPF